MLQRNKLDVLRDLDQATLAASGHDAEIDAAIQNYETAFRMQTAIPELMDLRGESDAVKNLYGMNASYASTKTFGLQCLLARRLVERGVRFIELTCPNGNGDRWDQHGKLVDGHDKNCLTVESTHHRIADRPETARIVGDHLGRLGRRSWPDSLCPRLRRPGSRSVRLHHTAMAGGGVKPGVSVGQSDDFGYRVVEDRFEIHDLHATMLHLLGIEHTKSTFRFSGRRHAPHGRAWARDAPGRSVEPLPGSLEVTACNRALSPGGPNGASTGLFLKESNQAN